MSDRPETRYAWNGDVALAYQVFGDGPVDLVYLQGYTSHVDLNWESPHLATFLRGLADHARVIMVDRRGWGCSDRFSPGDVAPLEVQVDDLVVVMEAAGSERAIIFGSWDTAPAATLFAAGQPDRTAGLVLCDPFVSFLATPQTPWMWTRADWNAINEELRQSWGTARYRGATGDLGGQIGEDREFLDWYLPWTRASVAPGALAAEFGTFAEVDVQSVLPSVQVPTLVVSGPRSDFDTSGMIRKNAAFIADRIMGARLLEPTPSTEIGWFHWYGRAPAIVEAIADLIVQVQEEQATFGRMLATVLFTDIVDSSLRAAELGDRAWGELLERHHAAVRAILARYRGEEIDTAGDGFFASFDGPARAVKAARSIVEAVRPLGIDVRTGIHTGEVQTMAGKIGGLGVVIGARVGALSGAGEVTVSSTVKDLTAGSGLVFEDAGEHELKGVPDRWHLYRVVS